jgi:hypothetical protein
MSIRAVLTRKAGICAILSLAFVAGCGGGNASGVSQGSTGTGLITTVTVSPASATVYQGATMQFTATVEGQSNQAVTWSLGQGSLGTIGSTGLYTAPKDASGTIQVVATSQADPRATGAAAVTVAPIVVKISPASVTLAPGGMQVFSATIEGLSDSSVNWTVQEAGGGIINSAGLYAAPVSVGFFHVIATSIADGTRSGSANIAVTTSSSSFTPTGDMQVARGFHTATLLGDGKVLVVGGAAHGSDLLCLDGLDSAELYDASTGSFSKTGNPTTAHYAHAATLLQGGEVLITGGFASGFDCEDLGEPAQVVAEVYNPATGAFESTGHMVEGRGGHTATLLPNGKVLVAGGGDAGGGTLPFFGDSSNTAELYDPATQVFTRTGSMVTSRFGHTATLLSNGKVLIVGGVESGVMLFQMTPTAELYDPATGTFTPTGSLAVARAGHTATLLKDGKVLIAGGLTNTQDSASGTASAEIYDPSTGTFTRTGDMGVAREAHTATLLTDGTVLIAGGGLSSPTLFAEIYDPSTGSFTPTGSMGTARVGHTATLLTDGRVLVAGSGYFLASAELYK